MPEQTRRYFLLQAVAATGVAQEREIPIVGPVIDDYLKDKEIICPPGACREYGTGSNKLPSNFPIGYELSDGTIKTAIYSPDMENVEEAIHVADQEGSKLSVQADGDSLVFRINNNSFLRVKDVVDPDKIEASYDFNRVVQNDAAVVIYSGDKQVALFKTKGGLPEEYDHALKKILDNFIPKPEKVEGL